MKKRLFLILSVTIMLAAGCGNKDNVVPDMETEATETVIDTEELDMAEDKEAPAADQAENGDTEKEHTEKETAKETEQEEGVILSILVYTFFSRMFDLCCLL